METYTGEHMKNKIILLALMLMLVTTAVSASSMNGDYKGNPIVKLKSNGSLIDSGEVPAMIYDDKTMVPIAALRNLGADVTWDQNTYSVDVKLPSGSIKQQISKINGNVRFATANGKLYAYSDFIQRTTYAEDQNIMWGVIQNLSDLSPDVVGMNYISKDNKLIGSFEIDNSHLVDLKNGIVSDVGAFYRVTGDLNGAPTSNNEALSAKEIAKLKDRVGYVTAFDKTQHILGQGSGFMIKPGIFITNYHVAGNTGGLRIQLDGTQYDTYGEYLFQNSLTDTFGVVIAKEHDSSGKVTGGYPEKMLDYSTILPEIGDKVYLIGSPIGFENTISEGIVSGIRNDGTMTYIQHTADTEGGSSGGALLNEYGQVIGIHSRIMKDGNSIKLAIPMMYVQQELDKINKK